MKKAVVSYNSMGEKSIKWMDVPSFVPVKVRRARGITTSPIGDRIGNQKEVHVPRPMSSSRRSETSEEQLDDPEVITNTTPMEVHDQTLLQSMPVSTSSIDKLAPGNSAKQRVLSPSFAQNPCYMPPDSRVLQALHIPAEFRCCWIKDSCWCASPSQFSVLWINDTDESETKQMCKGCHRQQHVLKLHRAKYSPLFSLRMILDIIADVYDRLVAPSQVAIAGAYSMPSSNTDLSIHETLYAVLLQRYGTQQLSQEKLMHLFVSTTHFLDVDAIVVFCELLGIYREYDIPMQMQPSNLVVAVCVSCYSWLYSRAMVWNGAEIIRRKRKKRIRDRDKDDLRAVESGKRTHWQFASLDHASKCAHDVLGYPLVGPTMLRNVLDYMTAFSQSHMVAPPAFQDLEYAQDSVNCSWLEVHRFLRVIIGEWKQHSYTFHFADQAIFAEPMRRAAGNKLKELLVRKLRLILSCFVFYDQDRVGVMTSPDFSDVLRRLRYLWPNECVTKEEARSGKEVSLTFENTVLAAKARFADSDHDGQICYLDFWAVMYVVGMKTGDLLKFREIPAFCKDYKLEVPSDMKALLLKYMKSACLLVLPKGLELEESTSESTVERQRKKRAGGLHDGFFDPNRTLGASLAAERLVEEAHGSTKSTPMLHIDGTKPAMIHSISTPTLEKGGQSTLSYDGVYADAKYGRQLAAHNRSCYLGPVPKRRAYITQFCYPPCRSRQILAPLPLLDRQEQGGGVVPQSYDMTCNNDSDACAQSYAELVYHFPFVDPHYRRLPFAPRDADGKNLRQVTSHFKGFSSESTDDEDKKEWETRMAMYVKHMEHEQLENRQKALNFLKEKRERRRQVVGLATNPFPALKHVHSSTVSASVGTPSVEDDQLLIVPSLDSNEVESLSLPSSSGNHQNVVRSSLSPDCLGMNAKVNSNVSRLSVSASSSNVEEDGEDWYVEATVPIIDEDTLQELESDNGNDQNSEGTSSSENGTNQPTLDPGLDVDQETYSATIESPPKSKTPPKTLTKPSEALPTEGVKQSPQNSSPVVSPMISKLEEQSVTKSAVKELKPPAICRGTNKKNLAFLKKRDQDNNIKSGQDNTGKLNSPVDTVDISESKEEGGYSHPTYHFTNYKTSKDAVDEKEVSVSSKAESPVELQVVQEEISKKEDVPSVQRRSVPVSWKRWDNPEVSIVFSEDSDNWMKTKWSVMFDRVEASVMSPVRSDFAAREKMQREIEQEQQMLMNKRVEQQAEDMKKLQHLEEEHRNDGEGSSHQRKRKNPQEAEIKATFRHQRVHRQSLPTMPNELVLGKAEQGECFDVENQVLYYSFLLPSDETIHILTVKLKLLCGNAEAFMSIDTTAPSATDHMWKSFTRVSTDKSDKDEGPKIIIYAPEIEKLLRKVKADDGMLSFYIAVKASVLPTRFAISVISSGQKVEPNKAIQTVDGLIKKFNDLCSSFEQNSLTSGSFENALYGTRAWVAATRDDDDAYLSDDSPRLFQQLLESLGKQPSDDLSLAAKQPYDVNALSTEMLEDEKQKASHLDAHKSAKMVLRRRVQRLERLVRKRKQQRLSPIKDSVRGGRMQTPELVAYSLSELKHGRHSQL